MSALGKRPVIVLLLIFFTGLTLQACSPAILPESTPLQVAPTAFSLEETEPSEAQVTESPDAPKIDPAASATVMVSEASIFTVEESTTVLASNMDPPDASLSPRPVKDQLEATPPGQVKLVSGKVQLIEFFAFW